MKHFILTLFLFITATSLFAQTAKVDTVITEKWNGSAWVNDSKIINTYDANCLLSNSLYQSWDAGSSSWVNEILTTNTYGGSNELTQQLGQSWDAGSSSWVDATRNTYAYDGSLRLTTLTNEIWLLTTWFTASQTTYSYNASNKVDSALTQSLFGTPTNSALQTYFYNGDGTDHQMLFQSWLSNAWVDQFRLTYSYDASSRISTILKEVPQGSTWVNSYLTTNTYNGSGYLTTALDQTWNGSAWVDDSRSTYSYTTSCTLPLKLISFTATKNKNIVTLNWQTADEINTSHFNIQRSVDGVNFSNVGNVNAKGTGGYSYSFADNIDNITKDKVYYRLQMMDKDGKYSFSKIIPLTLELFAGNIKTYPNPVKDQLYILFNAQNASKATIRISDASGKIVHTETVSTTANAVNVNVSRLGKGIYYVQLITDKGVQRTTFVKQ